MKIKKIFLGLLLSIIFFPFTLVDASSAKGYIDYPSNNAIFGDYMYIKGWAMSQDKDSKINLLIDEKNIDIDISRYERIDVINTITGYGGIINNPLPGFIGELNLDNYSEGYHNIKLEIKDNLGIVKASYEKEFLINRNLAKMYIDYPKTSTLVGNDLIIEGWIMSTISNGKFLVNIDGKEVDFEISRRERPDVVKAVTGYGDGTVNKKPGFTLNINSNELEEGTHIVEVFYVRNDGKILTSQSFNITKKINAKMYIDYPTNDILFDNELIIEGWIMSTASNGIFNLYIDGQEVEFEISRRKRPDVIKAIVGYGNEKSNPEPGFLVKSSLSNLSDGEHQIDVTYSTSTGILLEKSTTKISLKKNIGKMYIDNPKIKEVSSNLTIDGWIMTPNQNYQLFVYIDGVLVDTTFKRRSRVDVVNAIKGYGDIKLNKNPGFSTELDLNNYKDGKHYIEIVAISNEDILLAKESIEINLNKYTAKMYIDRAEYDYDKYETEMLVRGWVITDCPNFNIKLYIDNNYIKDITNRKIRDDVLKAFGNLYGVDAQNSMPGYEDYIDLSNIKSGNHEITVKIIDNKTEEIITEITKEINLVKYDNDMDIESPTQDEEILSDSINVKGWIMTDAKNITLKFYVDNQEVMPIELNRESRIDIINAFKNKYNTSNQNKNPGFNAKLNLSNLVDGPHIINVNIINNDTEEILISSSKKINVTKYKSDMYIDYPKDNISGTSMEISGWVLTEAKTNELELYIDGEKIDTSNSYRRARPDVLEAYKNKYETNEINKEPGFHNPLDLSNYKDGNHLITVKLINTTTKEVLVSKDKNFNLKKYDGMLHLEYPNKSNFSTGSKLYIQGWELSETANSIVKIYLDEKELNINREVRKDVINAHPNSYGGSANNITPGFNATYNLNEITSGEHHLTINLYSSFGDLIATTSKKILVFNNLYFGIDVSNHQGNINWDKVKKSGIDFAILRLGYGDNFVSQDDKEFINNVMGCVKNNIPYGVYLYSYATKLNGTSDLNIDSESIDSEIAHTLRVLNNLTNEQKSYLKLPVFLDMEDNSTIGVGKARLTEMADYYCNSIQKNRYKCGIYANKNWLYNYLDSSYLGNKYDIWLAHYTDDYNDLSDYNGIYNIWQYTSSGNMSGIYSSGLDMNVSFKKYW